MKSTHILQGYQGAFKGTNETVVAFSPSLVAPRFSDIQDVSDVSLVPTSLVSKSLPPLMLPLLKVYSTANQLGQPRNEVLWYRAAKGYMTIEAMKFYMMSVLDPYLRHLFG
jgi:hypothetical protein